MLRSLGYRAGLLMRDYMNSGKSQIFRIPRMVKGLFAGEAAICQGYRRHGWIEMTDGGGAEAPPVFH